VTVSFGAALLAGLLSFLSPCVLPLVPGYIGFLGGLGNRPNDASDQRKTIGSRLQLVMTSILFVAGFLTVFVALGASSSMAGSFVARHMNLFQMVGGGIITVLGLHFLGAFSIGVLNRDVRFMPSPKRFGTVWRLCCWPGLWFWLDAMCWTCSGYDIDALSRLWR
jgi:cytochrome c-type biogenesis protein